MATVFLSLLDRIEKFPAKLLELFSPSPATSSSSSGTSQIVEDLEKLRRRMERIRALLHDAEEREIRETHIRHWLNELRHVAYDSEDLLDEVEYELLRCPLAGEEEDHAPSTHEETRTRRKLGEVSEPRVTPCCPPLHHSSFQQQLVGKIERIRDMFDEIYEDGLKLRLHDEQVWRKEVASFVETTSPRMPTSCLVDERRVLGREGDQDEVIGLLLYDDRDVGCEENVRVVSIVGMGGLGKTTLAQLVYNDDQVGRHFQTKSWVCVSDVFDVNRLAREILREIRGSHPTSDRLEGFNSLQEILHKELQGNRFLLVLDDVWNENQTLWEALWACLLSGEEGSRVLITTPSVKVSRISRVSEKNMYRLGCLSEEDSWSLFEQRAFCGRNSGDLPNLEAIGRQIVNKCEGLPLAVKMLAGLLFCELREERWEDILRSELWELPEGKDHILPVLKLSYHHLPSPIKPCFAYCAAFPKDGNFYGEELVFMWMAQGYIKPTRSRCMEDVGRGYFEALLQRSFFQESGYNGSFVMHALIHDLALSICDGECYKFVGGWLPDRKARHLLFDCKGDLRRSLSCRTIDVRWRTLNVAKHFPSDDDYLDLETLDDMFVCMTNLRVLDLHNMYVGELPDSIGTLKYLRYLSIDGWSLDRLPESLGNLFNLQTLIVRNAYNHKELPRSIKNLVNLRHLIIEGEDLQGMPCGIGRLTQLQTLPRFVVGEGSGAAGIEELSGLNDLHGKLVISIRCLINDSNNGNNWLIQGTGGWHNDRKEVCILKNKQGVESLTLDFKTRCEEDSGSTSMHQEEALIKSLQPHTNIKELIIRGYDGRRFPKWMGDPSYSRLTRVCLRDCGNCRHIPAALGWLPSLKCLSSDVFFENEAIVNEASFFPSLEKLYFDCVKDGEELSVEANEGGILPCLHLLSIWKCHKLKYVKLRRLTALTVLCISGCQELRMLDFYNGGSISPSDGSPLLSSGCLVQEEEEEEEAEEEDEAVVGQILHIPYVQTMLLFDCPKLDFLPAQEQQLPLSLQCFQVARCPLMREWVGSHLDKLLCISELKVDHEHVGHQFCDGADTCPSSEPCN